METEERGTLKDGEPHPASFSALQFIKALDFKELCQWQESLSSCAIEGNRTAEVCSETLRRLLEKEPVSDRYLLGLAWMIFRKNIDKPEADLKKNFRKLYGD